MIKTIPQAIDDVAISLGADPSAEIPTVAQALENVYTALGGERTDLDALVVSEIIDLVAPLIQGGGGGGTTFPTFTDQGGTWSCGLTYAQTYDVMLSDGVGEDGSIPCIISNENWAVAYYYANDAQTQEIFPDIPETVNYVFWVADGGEPLICYADDGNIYTSKGPK